MEFFKVLSLYRLENLKRWRKIEILFKGYGFSNFCRQTHLVGRKGGESCCISSPSFYIPFWRKKNLTFSKLLFLHSLSCCCASLRDPHCKQASKHPAFPIVGKSPTSESETYCQRSSYFAHRVSSGLHVPFFIVVFVASKG